MAGVGQWVWHDLTVENAAEVRDFYKSVCGWTSEDVDMGGYADFNMLDRDGNVVGGVCHARGSNADLPPVWMPYVLVPDVDAAIAAAVAGGGELIERRVGGGDNVMVFLRDPAGAHIALWGKAGETE